MCGGYVSMFVVCPPGLPAGKDNQTFTTTVIGLATSDPATCGFTMVSTNQCGGATGCYGVIAVTPPVTGTDPGWSTCTGASCPSPRQ